MDRFIAKFETVADGDLTLCPWNGVAYQTDMSHRVVYDGEYFNKCLGYEGKDIALRINAGRVAFVNQYVGADAGCLDIGVGSGEFIKKRPNTFGYDINPHAVEWLKANNRWANGMSAFDAFTFWDVIEHLENPEEYFRRVGSGAYLFASIPFFNDLRRIRESKHYRPGEHLLYFTAPGFLDWMDMHGFSFLEMQDYETMAGRENILSFAFQRR